MKNNKFIATIIIVLISAFLFTIFGNSQQQSQFSASQKEEINSLIHDYLLENPDIIPEVINILRARQSANILTNQQELLYNDGYSFVTENDQADITIVEFYDYNCGYCKQVPDVFNALLKADNKIKIIYKELPILAQSSEYASKAAMASIKQGKFMDFHLALMKNKRQLTEGLVLQIAKDSGLDQATLIKDMADPQFEINLKKTKQLVQDIGISGTPGFVIGNQIIPGFMPYEKLKEIIDKTRSNQNS